MSKEKVSLEVVNPNAAGIDVGSRSHWVAVGQNAEDVKEFGVYAEDLQQLALWLLKNKTTTVAMESTGTYWQNLFSILATHGLEVILVNGQQTKNRTGKKTDIRDCQWIQKLHTLGLLSSSFLPDSTTEILRTYTRHRLNLIEQSADTMRKMQKYLRLLNLRLDVAVNDIAGETGQKIIEAIVQGETSGVELAKLRHHNCRKSETEIAKALQTNGRNDYMFSLKHEWKQFQFTQNQLAECDVEIEKLLRTIVENDDNKRQHIAPEKSHKRIGKNAMKNIDINQVGYQYFEGVDLMEIAGLNRATLLTLISEVGLEGMRKFQNAKQFASWLRLAPNNKISGGKILSHSVPRGSSRLKIALRNAANAIGNLKDNHLSDFFHRIAFKRGRASAISATARKLAVIIWNMVVKHLPYNPPTEYIFVAQKKKQRLIARIKKQVAKFEIKPQDVGFAMS